MSNSRVLVIENGREVTGGLKSIIRSCVLLQDHFHFEFLVPNGSKVIPTLQAHGFEVSEMPFVEIRRSWKIFFSYLPMLFNNSVSLRAILSRKKIDLIIANDFYNLVPAVYQLMGGRVPYVSFVRMMPNRFPRYLVTTWCFLHLRYAKSLIAVSNAVKDNLPKHEKITMIYNELPTEAGFGYFKYEKMSKRILNLTNYIPGKGLEFVIQAFAAISEKYPQWHLRFVGSDMGLKKNKEYKEYLKNLAADLDVLHKIEWNDFSNQPADEYKNAAIVLNFSDSESFSLTCMEAMFIGRPVIATRCGGPEEIIDDSDNGYLVGRGNLPEMISALDKLIASDVEKRESIGRKAHISVSEKFSVANTVDKLIPLLHAALR